MRRALAGVTVAMLSALPGSAMAGALDLRLGAFLPREESNLFSDDRELYTVKRHDWNGFTGGAEYSFRVAPSVELGIHMDGYGRSLDTVYRDFETSAGRDIGQTLKLEIVPVGVTLRLVAGGRRAAVAPYFGGGADLYYWRYEEFGDFIDFAAPSRPIIADSFLSDGVTAGGHVVAGVRVRLNHDFNLAGEARYHLAPKVAMGDDFRGNTLDLSGWSATLGVHVEF